MLTSAGKWSSVSPVAGSLYATATWEKLDDGGERVETELALMVSKVSRISNLVTLRSV